MIEPLPVLERRTLGVLVEKALTAAAPEPLTLNAIVVGSNQKSNREPVMEVEEPEVDDALTRLARKGLVFRITGGRTERWRHNLYEAWRLNKSELALVAELLLRGPQTAAEARARASRMEPIDQETATSAIKSLAERKFIVWLMPEGRRGALLTHGFHIPEELARFKGMHASSSEVEDVTHRPATTTVIQPAMNPLVDRMSVLETRLTEAFGEVGKLREEVRHLRANVVELQTALGVTPSS